MGENETEHATKIFGLLLADEDYIELSINLIEHSNLTHFFSFNPLFEELGICHKDWIENVKMFKSAWGEIIKNGVGCINDILFVWFYNSLTGNLPLTIKLEGWVGMSESDTHFLFLELYGEKYKLINNFMAFIKKSLSLGKSELRGSDDCKLFAEYKLKSYE